MNANLTYSKYEDIETVSRITHIETALSREFEPWNAERYENFNIVAGKLFTKSEMEKLASEGRPVFNFNSIKPLITQIAGAYKNNLVSVEAMPRTDDDLDKAKLMTNILQWVLHTKNDSDYEFGKSFLDAAIARLGWIATEWVHKNNELFIEVKHYDPFRLKFDMDCKSRDLSDCRYIIDSGWYSIEEILNIYALEDIDLWSEIEDKAKYLFGNNQNKKLNSVSWLERVQGTANQYSKDNKIMDVETSNINNQNFYTEKGLFKVIEAHERRSERVITLYDNIEGKNYDITKKVMVKGELDREKLSLIRSQFIEPYISQSIAQNIYVTAIIPALNIKTLEAPYPIEMPGFNFKFTPVYCYDYHPDAREVKSVVDDLKDASRAYTKHLNSMQEALARSINSTILYEEDALGEYEEAFKKNRIGGIKKVPQGTISGNKIKEFNTNPNLTSFQNMSLTMLEYMKFNSGVRDNAMGTRENANESGTLFNQRVAQTEVMQEYINENSQAQIMQVCKKVIMYIQKYMTNQQVLRITDSESEEQKLIEVNKETVDGILNDLTIGEYDIILSKAPYGRTAKDVEYQKLIGLVDLLIKVDPMAVKEILPTLVKASGTSYAKHFIEALSRVQQSTQEQMQANAQPEPQQDNVNAQLEQAKIQAELQIAQIALQKEQVLLEREKLSLQKEVIKNQSSKGLLV